MFESLRISRSSAFCCIINLTLARYFSATRSQLNASGSEETGRSLKKLEGTIRVKVGKFRRTGCCKRQSLPMTELK